MAMSGFLANAILGLLQNNTQIAAFGGANRYVALHSANPTKSCLVGELSGDNYARVQLSLTNIQLAKGKGITNDAVLVWPIASGTKVEQITHWSIWDQSSNGNPITYGALSTPLNWISGSSLSLGINAFIQLLQDTL